MRATPSRDVTDIVDKIANSSLGLMNIDFFLE
jgi:hypothetical protein